MIYLIAWTFLCLAAACMLSDIAGPIVLGPWAVPRWVSGRSVRLTDFVGLS